MSDLKVQMAKAMERIADKFEIRMSGRDEFYQETNIFKILKVDQYEIRHGAFLEFLLDPERNPVLAYFFLEAWLEEIVSDLSLDDAQLYKITQGEYEGVSYISGADRYSEIPVKRQDGNYRIDHALEVQLKGTRRVFVFEYKHNGIVQNDLKVYREFIETAYSGRRADVYCFVLELSHKIHRSQNQDGWHYIQRETLVKAVARTLEQARLHDMQATRLYLEQYLEILQPDPDDYELLKECKPELWSLWNPEVAKADPEANLFNSLLEEYVSSDWLRDLLESFNYHMLFDWIVSDVAKSMLGLTARVNSGWVRLTRGGCPRNIYLSTYLHEESSGQLFMGISIESWQGTKTPIDEAKKNYNLLRKAISEHSEVGQRFNGEVDMDGLRYVSLVKDGEVLKQRNHQPESKTKYKFTFNWLWSIDHEVLERIITGDSKPEIFKEWLEDLDYWSMALSGG